MSNLRGQDTRSTFVLACNGVAMAFLNVGHGRDQTYNPKDFKRPSFNLCGYRLLYQVIRSRSYANVTKSMVAQFIKKEIICRYGLSKRIISDNGLNLNNNMITEICTRFKIKHHNSVPYRPKMNGAVEATNKNVKTNHSQSHRDI